MDINKLLEWIEGFEDLGIVRLFSHLYSETLLSPYLGALQRSMANTSPAATARKLLVVALLLLVLVFAVDQVLYYSDRGVQQQVKNRAARGAYALLTLPKRIRGGIARLRTRK